MTPKKVQALWEKQAGRRYVDLLDKKRKAEKQPHWVESATWDSWMACWSSSEFKAKFVLQSRNRNLNPSKHTSGSVYHRRVKQRMEKRLGREVGPDELYVETYTPRSSNRTEFIDQRSKDFHERT